MMPKMFDKLEAIAAGRVPGPPIGNTVGFRLVSVKPGVALFEMETCEAHYNPMGTVHGGVLCDIADAAMGVAYASELAEGESFTTLELKINFLRPVWKARLRAVGTVVKRGRTVGMTQCDVADSDGNLVARATGTCLTLRGEQAKGR